MCQVFFAQYMYIYVTYPDTHAYTSIMSLFLIQIHYLEVRTSKLECGTSQPIYSSGRNCQIVKSKGFI